MYTFKEIKICIYFSLQKKVIMANVTNPTNFTFYIPSTNLTFVKSHLRHFAAYNVEVQACREQVGVNDSMQHCSTKSMKTYRTLPLENADDIPSSSFEINIISMNDSLPIAKVQWKEPESPNGLIVTYQIKYKRVDIPNVSITFFFISFSILKTGANVTFDISFSDKVDCGVHHGDGLSGS